VGRGEGIGNEVRDLNEALEYLVQSTTGVEQVVLIGKSLGSIVAANVAAEGSRHPLPLKDFVRQKWMHNNAANANSEILI